jgi:hypothetical protein
MTSEVGGLVRDLRPRWGCQNRRMAQILTDARVSSSKSQRETHVLSTTGYERSVPSPTHVDSLKQLFVIFQGFGSGA